MTVTRKARRPEAPEDNTASSQVPPQGPTRGNHVVGDINHVPSSSESDDSMWGPWMCMSKPLRERTDEMVTNIAVGFDSNSYAFEAHERRDTGSPWVDDPNPILLSNEVEQAWEAFERIRPGSA